MTSSFFRPLLACRDVTSRIRSFRRSLTALSALGVIGCAGGETSDFGSGSWDGCIRKVRPLTEERADQYGLDRVKAQTAGSWRVPLDWQQFPGSTDVSPESSFATVTARLGEPKFIETTPWQEASSDFWCPDYVTFPASVSIAADDGSLTGTISGSLYKGEYDVAWNLFGWANLEIIRHRLDLGIDPHQGHHGRLELDVYGFPSGVRGAMTASAVYSSLTSDYETRGVHTTWPMDDCPEDYEPVDLDESDARWGGVSVAELEAEAHALVNDALPLDARWLDRSETRVSLEWGAIQSACVSSSTVNPTFKLQTSGYLTTLDGRLRTPVSSVMVRVEPGAERHLWLEAWADFDFTNDASVESVAGLSGVNTEGASLVEGGWSAHFYWGDGDSTAEGFVIIDGVPACTEPAPSCGYFRAFECVYWPASGDAPATCDRDDP